MVELHLFITRISDLFYSLFAFRQLKLNTYLDWFILYTQLIYICLHLNYEINISEMQLFIFVLKLKTLLSNCQPYG